MLIAIYYFYNKKIDLAKKEINKCRQLEIKDASWKYCDAFLTLYDNGKISTSYKKYRKAFKYHVSSDFLIFIEDFIDDVLKQEPERYQLNFALSLISDFRGDIIAATDYFTKFYNNLSEHGIVLSNVVTDVLEAYKSHLKMDFNICNFENTEEAG